MKKLRIAKSKIAGRGIFASENIPKGDLIVEMHGKLFHKVYKTEADLRIGRTWVPIKKHWWIAPQFPIKFLNHCCEPNAGFKTPQRLYAMKDIKEGEEITADYATIEYVDFWNMPCECGARHCRKKMHSVQFLTKKEFEGYLPYIPRFLQKIYLQYNNGSHKRKG